MGDCPMCIKGHEHYFTISSTLDRLIQKPCTSIERGTKVFGENDTYRCNPGLATAAHSCPIKISKLGPTFRIRTYDLSRQVSTRQKRLHPFHLTKWYGYGHGHQTKKTIQGLQVRQSNQNTWGWRGSEHLLATTASTKKPFATRPTSD